MSRGPSARQILIVEDDRDIRETLAEVLTDASYEPVAVANGREALECLSIGIVKPSVILLDLMMPVMDGREFREIQSSDVGLSSIPVILFTAQVNHEHSAQTMGNIRCLRKPVDLVELLQTIASVCDDRVGNA
jgi:CheY-like chemotaxis protein